MRISLDPTSLGAGVIVGAAASTLGAPYVAGLVHEVTWTSLATSGALAACAVAVLFRRGAGTGPTALDPNAPTHLPVDRSPAETPAEWLLRNGVLDGPSDTDADRIRTALSRQLHPAGQPMPATHEALLACILARGSVPDGDGVGDPLSDLAEAMASHDASRDARVAEVGRRAATATGADAASRLARLHGTRETTFVAALAAARAATGSLPTCDFAWLRDADRGLWFALNNLGRRSFHVEGMAAMAHHEAEVARGHALISHELETAVAPLARHATDTRSGQGGVA